jgi:hypothetical protein
MPAPVNTTAWRARSMRRASSAISGLSCMT